MVPCVEYGAVCGEWCRVPSMDEDLYHSQQPTRRELRVVPRPVIPFIACGCNTVVSVLAGGFYLIISRRRSGLGCDIGSRLSPRD
jgi:hypothetical protein